MAYRVLVPPPAIKARARKVLSPNHWTTRELPTIDTLKNYYGKTVTILKSSRIHTKNRYSIFTTLPSTAFFMFLLKYSQIHFE